ncbi:UNVERIFIED_CONTAM: hypothetical protein FKN15_036480 [Acipenser sinensis]
MAMQSPRAAVQTLPELSAGPPGTPPSQSRPPNQLSAGYTGLPYTAPYLAAECLSAAFQGDRARAVVLDVACGTGLVASLLQKMGFQNFHGVDGSEGMLHLAHRKGLYQDLKQCILGARPLPAPAESYDAVLIVGALSVGQVPCSVIRELWQVTKPGGYVCMTTRANASNREYKEELESVLQLMEQTGLWSRVTVLEEDLWEKAVSDQESGYIPGVVYLYRKSVGATHEQFNAMNQ